MTIRFYLEEDSMRHALARALRARGVDVSTALEAGRIERLDAHHLEYATAQGRTLYSFNIGDFYRLHTTFRCSPVSILKKVNPPTIVRLPHHTTRRIDPCEPPKTGANRAPIPSALISSTVFTG